jgi:hypothetical protein
MKYFIIFAFIAAASALPNRQYRQSGGDPPLPISSLKPIAIVEPVQEDQDEPTKFGTLLNVTWNPEWIAPAVFNYSEFQDNFNQKLGSLGNIDFTSGFNSNTSLSSQSSLVSLDNLINWNNIGNSASASISAAYTFVGSVIYPATITAVLLVGVFYIIQMVIQVFRHYIKTSL